MINFLKKNHSFARVQSVVLFLKFVMVNFDALLCNSQKFYHTTWFCNKLNYFYQMALLWVYFSFFLIRFYDMAVITYTVQQNNLILDR